MAENAPSYTIAVSRSPGESRMALLVGDALLEVVHRRDADIQPGSVYAGRIGARVPGIDAVFVEIGHAVPGVLKIKSPPPEGTAIAVSVVVPARADKGAELKAVNQPLNGASIPSLLTAAPDPVLAWWVQYGPDIQRIVCNTAREAKRVEQTIKGASAQVHNGTDLFTDLGIDEAIETALRHAVALPGGGSLLIETTSAVTAIDINSGSSDPATANHAAMAVIARELRKRNVAGHLVIDVIPGKGTGALPRLLTRALGEDPIPARVAGVTPLGMIELTRQRLGLSLAEQLLDETGALSVASTAYACLRHSVRQALSEKIATPAVFAAPDVVALLQGPLRAALVEANDILKTEIVLKSDSSFARARFMCKPA